MVAADGEHAGVFDGAIGVNDEIGCTAADINDERAQFFLLARSATRARKARPLKTISSTSSCSPLTRRMEFCRRLVMP